MSEDRLLKMLDELREAAGRAANAAEEARQARVHYEYREMQFCGEVAEAHGLKIGDVVSYAGEERAIKIDRFSCDSLFDLPAGAIPLVWAHGREMRAADGQPGKREGLRVAINGKRARAVKLSVWHGWNLARGDDDSRSA